MGFLTPGIKNNGYKKRRDRSSDSPRPEKRSCSSSTTNSTESTPTSTPPRSRCSTPLPSSRRKSKKPTSSSPAPSSSPAVVTAPLSSSSQTHKLSPLELLPTELVQKVFLLSTNLSLPLASPRLHHLLADRFLQLKILYSAYGHPDALTDLISRRFFNSHILHSCESRYGRLDLTGVLIPSRLLKAPFTTAHLILLDELVTRGATLDSTDSETPDQGLRQAVKLHCTAAIAILINVVGVRCSPETVAMAIEAEVPMRGPGGMEVLMRACEKKGDARIWWAALGRTSKHDCNGKESKMRIFGEMKKEMLEYLLKMSTPPGEVLGAIGAITIR